MKVGLGILISLGLSISCGKSASKTDAGVVMDLTKNDLIQFKSAVGLGVSASRYDLTLASKSLKKYKYSSSAMNYVSEKELTMTEAAKSSLSLKLKKISHQVLPACSDAVCTAGRPSVWIELPNLSPPQYYFSNQGDCSCSSDGDNAPTLSYSQINGIYQDLLTLLGS